MVELFPLVAIASAIVAVVLAVARDVPILEVLGHRKTPAGKRAAFLVGIPVILGVALQLATPANLYGVRPIAVVAPMALAYFWWCVGWRLRVGAAALIAAACCSAPAIAWNALGHRVVASIAYGQLDEATRKLIADTIRRNPRFDEDFAPNLPAEDQDRFIFQQAAVWPDMIRGKHDYDMPVWHYVDFPLFVGPVRPHSFPLGTKPEGDRGKWNVMQALSYCQSVVADKDTAPRDKALAYCWIFHLVGDLHQPCHSTALICEKLPEGDRGGNSIPLVTGRNLHSLWDGLLGRADKPNDVKHAVLELDEHPEWRKVDVTTDVPAWVAESHELAKSFVYCPEILAAVERPGALTPITLPDA
jgi:hypothetical protein